MTFSVVIPSYGQAKYLKGAILSALGQTYPSYEVIVVDDGSTDGSLEIASQFIPRIRVIEQTNRGLASARNTGIMNARGDYVMFLDADDELFPNALEQIWKRFSRDGWGGYDAVVPSIRCVDEKSGDAHDTILMENPTFEDFKVGNRLAYCGAIRRGALRAVGGYSPKMDVLGGWEDLHMWYNLLERGFKITTLQEPLVMYRIKENSMWKNAEKNKELLWKQIVKDFPRAQDHVKA